MPTPFSPRYTHAAHIPANAAAPSTRPRMPGALHARASVTAARNSTLSGRSSSRTNAATPNATAERPPRSKPRAARHSAIPAVKSQPKSMALDALASSSGHRLKLAIASQARAGGTRRAASTMPHAVTTRLPALQATSPPRRNNTAQAASCSGKPKERLRRYVPVRMDCADAMTRRLSRSVPQPSEHPYAPSARNSAIASPARTSRIRIVQALGRLGRAGQYQRVMHARKQSFFEKKDQKNFCGRCRGLS